MTHPDPNAQPSNQPPPVHQPHPETPQRPPVIVQNSGDSDLTRQIHSAVTDLGNKLSGLPESIVHSFREATNTTPPAAPTGQQPSTPQAQTAAQNTPPSQQTTPPPAQPKQGNAFTRWWFGAKS